MEPDEVIDYMGDIGTGNAGGIWRSAFIALLSMIATAAAGKIWLGDRLVGREEMVQNNAVVQQIVNDKFNDVRAQIQEIKNEFKDIQNLLWQLEREQVHGGRR